MSNTRTVKPRKAVAKRTPANGDAPEATDIDAANAMNPALAMPVDQAFQFVANIVAAAKLDMNEDNTRRAALQSLATELGFA